MNIALISIQCQPTTLPFKCVTNSLITWLLLSALQCFNILPVHEKGKSRDNFWGHWNISEKKHASDCIMSINNKVLKVISWSWVEFAAASRNIPQSQANPLKSDLNVRSEKGMCRVRDFPQTQPMVFRWTRGKEKRKKSFEKFLCWSDIKRKTFPKANCCFLHFSFTRFIFRRKRLKIDWEQSLREKLCCEFDFVDCTS